MEIRLLETFVPAGQRLLQEKPIERPPSPNIYSHPEKPQERKTEKLLAAEMYAVIVGAELPNYEQDIYQEQLDMAIVNVNPGSESTCDTSSIHAKYGRVKLSPGWVMGERPVLLSSAKTTPVPSMNDEEPCDMEDEGFEEELYIHNATVVWTKAGRVVREYTFHQEQQPVLHALWVWFDRPPIHRVELPKLSTRPEPIYIDQSISMPKPVPSSEPPQRTRALCVILRDMARIFLKTGLEYTIRIPFLVIGAWALSTGLLVQTVPGHHGFHEDTLAQPTLFTLQSPLDEFRIVSIAHHVEVRPDTKQVVVMEPIEPWAEPVYSVCLVTQGNAAKNAGQWIVTRDNRTGLHHLWKYVSKASHSTRLGGANSRQSLSRRDSNISLQRSGSLGPCSGANIDYFKGIRSETFVQHVWTEPEPVKQDKKSTAKKKVSRAKTAASSEGGILDLTSQVFMAQDVRGTPVLAIMRPQTQRLDLYRLNVTEGRSNVIDLVHILAIPAVSAAPVCATRKYGCDVLVLKTDGDMALWYGEEGAPLLACKLDPRIDQLLESSIKDSHKDVAPFSSPKPRSQKATTRRAGGIAGQVRLQLPVYNRVNLVLSEKQVLRVVLDFIPRSPLVQDCLDALSYAWPSEIYSRFYLNYLQYQYANADQQPYMNEEKEWHNLCAILLLACSLTTPHPVKRAQTTSTPVARRTRGRKPSTTHETDREETHEMSKNDDDDNDDEAWQWLLTSDKHRAYQKDPLIHQLKLPEPVQPEEDTIYRLMKQAQKIPQTYCVALDDIQKASTLYALHTIYEDYKLNTLIKHRLAWLGELLVQLAVALGWERYLDYYWRDGQRIQQAMHHITMPAQPIGPEWMWQQPFSITEVLSCCETAVEALAAFPHPKLLSERLKHTVYQQIHKHRCCERIDRFSELYRALNTSIEQFIEVLVNRNWTTVQIERLPLIARLPVLEALHYCRMYPGQHWPKQAYILIEREDLVALLDPDYVSTHPRIIMDDMDNSKGEEDYDGTRIENEFTRLRFNTDRRISEVQRILQSTKPIKQRLFYGPQPEDRMEMYKQKQLRHLGHLVLRTTAQPIGRALFTYGTCKLDPYSTCPIPKFDIACKFSGSNQIARLDAKNEGKMNLCWIRFHNGVAAGLRLGPNANRDGRAGIIDGSWIALNNPKTINETHGGFLFALGLTGHLKALVNWQSYGYLVQSSEIVTTGLLLGMAAAQCGTKNLETDKALMLHAVNMSSTNGIDFFPKSYIKAVSMLGIGLLYLGTKDRRKVEIMLDEMSRFKQADTDAENNIQYSYLLAASFALGFIMLGAGDDNEDIAELNIRNRLFELITGDPTVPHGHPRMLNTVATAPGAIVALALIYLRTNNVEYAERIAFPRQKALLDTIRNDTIILRTLCSNLILWDSIKPTREWIEITQVPDYIRESVKQLQEETVQIRNTNVYYYAMCLIVWYNIVGGACFSIGFRYAGTGDKEVGHMLLKYYLYFSKICSPQNNVRLFGSQNYYNQLARTTARESMNVVGIAMAMVMAGTGDLELFKALRTTQCRIATDMVHGDYLAASIGIGLLFLGGGRTTLNRSNRSIALMLCAFYPQFPATPEDNGPHLQVFRHLWAMAAEQRGIIACDVNTGEACSVNIELKVIEDTPATHTPVRIRDDIDGDDVQYVNGQLVRKVYMKTPCIFPPFDKIYSLKVVDEKYFPVELTPSSNPVHAKILETYNIIYVKQLRSRSSSKRSLADLTDALTSWLLTNPNHPSGKAPTIRSEQISELEGDYQASNILLMDIAKSLCDDARRCMPHATQFGDIPELLAMRCASALYRPLTDDISNSWSIHLALYRTADHLHRKMHNSEPVDIWDLHATRLHCQQTCDTGICRKPVLDYDFTDLLFSWVTALLYARLEDKENTGILEALRNYATVGSYTWQENYLLRWILIWFRIPTSSLIVTTLRQCPAGLPPYLFMSSKFPTVPLRIWKLILC